MTELSLEKALTTFGWVFSQIGKFYTFWAFLSRFPGGWGACLLVDLLVWSSVVLCFAVLAGDWQPADRKRPRVASDHIVIARIHGELLRLHILGTPPSWIRILLSVISSSGEFLHFYIFTLPIFVVAVKFRLLLWRPGTAWWCASFCGVGAMPPSVSTQWGSSASTCTDASLLQTTSVYTTLQLHPVNLRSAVQPSCQTPHCSNKY